MLGTNLSFLLFLLLATGTMFAVYLAFNPEPGDAAAVVELVGDTRFLSAPLTKMASARPVSQRLAQSEGPLMVGVIAGHTGFDPGAVCDDGLTEAQVNYGIAQAVVDRLNAAGVHADLMLEFDDRLNGFDGTALISLHADSCESLGAQASGFKIAGSSFTDSSRLSICVEDAYRRATGLSYHANTITPHMTDYHAFREIAVGTPAIILELGFMNADRALLTEQSERSIEGVTEGIRCFLQGGTP
jgi:N-acetylmuramoyl-L-alanine amidase